MRTTNTATIIPRDIALFTEDAKVIRRIPKGTKVKILSDKPSYITLFGDKAYTLVDDGINVGHVLSEALLKDGD